MYPTILVRSLFLWQLSIFSHRFMSIAEQMGRCVMLYASIFLFWHLLTIPFCAVYRVLQRTAISTNIKVCMTRENTYSHQNKLLYVTIRNSLEISKALRFSHIYTNYWKKDLLMLILSGFVFTATAASLFSGSTGIHYLHALLQYCHTKLVHNLKIIHWVLFGSVSLQQPMGGY